jgi:hypothetical protein
MIKRPYYYKLEGKTPVALGGPRDEKVLLKWADEFGDAKKRVLASSPVTPKVFVSTVFLGLDHYFGPDIMEAPPVLFETMIFGGQWRNGYYQERYTTWDAAVMGHWPAIELVKRSLWQRLRKGKPKLARLHAKRWGMVFDEQDEMFYVAGPVELDKWGKLLDVERNGRPDADYRLALLERFRSFG